MLIDSHPHKVSIIDVHATQRPWQVRHNSILIYEVKLNIIPGIISTVDPKENLCCFHNENFFCSLFDFPSPSLPIYKQNSEVIS